MHPKKYKTGNYSIHAFGSCGNFGLNCVRTIRGGGVLGYKRDGGGGGSDGA